MKYIFCKICHSVVQLTEKFRRCRCGNAIGKYLSDNSTVEVAFYCPDYGFVGGISNRYFQCDEPYVPDKDGGYFAKQGSAITKIPLNEDSNDVIVRDWKPFFIKNDIFRIKYIMLKFWLDKFGLKNALKLRQKYSRHISKGDEVDFISLYSGKTYRIGINDLGPEYGTAYVNEIIDGESYTRNVGLIAKKQYYSPLEIFELQHIEYTWNGSGWIRE
jgi:hypothetical protein